MRINYDFTDLEAFLEVYDTGSFFLAAQQLNMSQPTLTRRVQKLENALGVQLFERTTRSVRITLAGRGFHERAQAILGEARAAQTAMRDSDQYASAKRNAVITVATVPSATHNILPNAIRQHMKRGMSVRYRILESLAGETLDLVRDGEADFGISFGGLDDPVLNFTRLQTDRFVLALSETHPLARTDPIMWADLAGEDLIVPLKGTGNRLMIDNALAEFGLSLSWAFESRNSSTMLSLIQAGLGIAALPVSAIPVREGSGVIFRELESPQVTRSIGLVTRKAGGHSAAVQSFLEALSGGS